MTKLLTTLSIGFLALGVAQAASVTYTDASLAPIFGSTNNAVYFGSGNPNGGWNIVTNTVQDPTTPSQSDTVEVGLRAKNRFDGVIDPTGNVYTVPGGVDGNGDNFWNYEFSIDLNEATPGTSNLNLSNIVASIIIEDTNTDAILTYNPIGPDDGEVGPGKVQGGTTANDFQANGWGVQNSENIGFFVGLPLNPAFTPAAGDSYTVTLEVDAAGGILNGTSDLIDDTIDINTAPEPATFGLIGLSLFGLAAIRKKLLA